MALRPGMPDHIRQAILSGDRELLRRAGKRGATKRLTKKKKEVKQKTTKIEPDWKSRASGERDDD